MRIWQWLTRTISVVGILLSLRGSYSLVDGFRRELAQNDASGEGTSRRQDLSKPTRTRRLDSSLPSLCD
jgi:hypothetical protein